MSHADSSTFDCFIFTSIFYTFVRSCEKFSTSRSVKVLKLCQLISSRIIAAINMMSTLMDNYMVIAQLISLDLSVICDNKRNGFRQAEIFCQ